jgi:hypothetical protein
MESRGFGAVLFSGMVVAAYAAWRTLKDREAEPQFYVVERQPEAPKFNSAPLIGWGLDTLFSALGGQGRAAPPVAGSGGWHPDSAPVIDLGEIFMGGAGGTTGTGYQTDRTNYSGMGPGGIDFGAYEQKYGLPGGYLQRTGEIESNLNPNAKNPNSSASGLFQFIRSTAKQYGLTNPFDPVASTDAASRLARDNAAYLRARLGREPTGAELYLAHQQGAGGAWRLLRDKNARAADVVGSSAVRLNGGNSDMTAGEFANLWLSKYQGG